MSRPERDWCAIPAGWVQMGTPLADLSELEAQHADLDVKAGWFGKEVPRHAVYVDAFSMAIVPVTVGDFRIFGAANGERFDVEAPDDWPAAGISHAEATHYADWLSCTLGTPARLPTEQEWERAARGDELRETPWDGPYTPEHGNLLEAGIDHPTAATNIATLVAVVADQPEARVLNVADADSPDVRTIASVIAERLGQRVKQVLIDGAAPCRSPWDAVPPRVLDTTAAQSLGWQPLRYAEALNLGWLTEDGPGDERLPERLFDYAAEDRLL